MPLENYWGYSPGMADLTMQEREEKRLADEKRRKEFQMNLSLGLIDKLNTGELLTGESLVGTPVNPDASTAPTPNLGFPSGPQSTTYTPQGAAVATQKAFTGILGAPQDALQAQEMMGKQQEAEAKQRAEEAKQAAERKARQTIPDVVAPVPASQENRDWLAARAKTYEDAGYSVEATIAALRKETEPPKPEKAEAPEKETQDERKQRYFNELEDLADQFGSKAAGFEHGNPAQKRMWRYLKLYDPDWTAPINALFAEYRRKDAEWEKAQLWTGSGAQPPLYKADRPTLNGIMYDPQYGRKWDKLIENGYDPEQDANTKKVQRAFGTEKQPLPEPTVTEPTNVPQSAGQPAASAQYVSPEQEAAIKAEFQRLEQEMAELAKGLLGK